MLQTADGDDIMKTLVLPITARARKYGYITWTLNLDPTIKEFLNGAPKIRLFFQGTDFGEKKVDWRYHRISIGYRWTRGLPTSVSEYKLQLEDENVLRVVCK